MKKLLMLGAAVLTMQAMPALAEDGKKPHRGEKMLEKMFEHQDTNKDGSISKDEAVANASKRFDDMDGNKDGKVTKDEVKAHHEAKRAEWKAKKDGNKDVEAPTPAPAE